MGESAVGRKITNATLWRRRSVSAPGQLAVSTRGMGRATAMMGPAHSLSGAAAWLGVGAAAAATGHTMPWPVLLVGALICAGAALAPDLDHKAATISRAFGPVSRGLCEIVDKLSYAVYKATKKAGRPASLRRAPHSDAHLAVGGADRCGSLGHRRSREAAGGSWRSSSCTWCSPSRGCSGGRRAAPAPTSWCGCWPRRVPGSSREYWTSRATAPTGCSRRRARSTCGSDCRSCSARWCTTSGTR